MSFGMKVPASTSFRQLRRRARLSSFRPRSFAFTNEITNRPSAELPQHPDAGAALRSASLIKIDGGAKGNSERISQGRAYRAGRSPDWIKAKTQIPWLQAAGQG